MERTCDITYDGTPVGSAKIKKTGLYYQFSCRCKLPQKGMYRLWANCGQQNVKLGVCMPQDDGFGLSARIPVKQLGEGDICISARSGNETKRITAIAIREDEPFERLKDLDAAYLRLSENQPEIAFKDRSAAPRDSGQSPEPLHGSAQR